MAETIEVEVDDAHKFMFKELMEGREDPPELDEWAKNVIENVIYNNYKNNR